MSRAAAEPPFAPVRDVVDHVVIMRESQGGTRTVTHGAGWFRVDASSPAPGSTTYYDHPVTVSVTPVRERSGEYTSLAIVRGLARERPAGIDHNSYRTGERQVILGEPCTIWNIMRSRDADPRVQFRKYSCVTDDGIELAYRSVGAMGVILSGEATKIERRSVPASEAHPPRGLLDLKAWVKTSVGDSASGATPVDFESEMKGVEIAPGRNGTTARTTRRHHPWVWIEDRLADGALILSIENKQTRLYIHFESEPGGEYRKLSLARLAPPIDLELEAKRKTLQEELQKRAHELQKRADELQKRAGQAKGGTALPRRLVEAPGEVIVRPPRHPVPVLPLRASRPAPFEPSLMETVLSESCTWFDMTPGLMDAGFSQCRSTDDLALKEDQWWRGGRQILEAVRLERRAVALDEVLPAADILSPEKWGLPK